MENKPRFSQPKETAVNDLQALLDENDFQSRRVNGVGITRQEARIDDPAYDFPQKMCPVFWDFLDALQVNYTKEKINSEYYIDLANKFRNKRHKTNNPDLYFIHDNTQIPFHLEKDLQGSKFKSND